jgi:hypothetical protein
VIDLIGALPNAPSPMLLTDSVRTSQGKKTDEGAMMLPSAPESNPAAIAESPQTPNLTLATTKDASDILIRGKI